MDPRNRRRSAQGFLADRRLRAGGTVSDIRVRAGQPLQPGEPIATIVQPGAEPEAYAFLPSKDRPSLRTGQTLQVDLIGYTKARERATITAIGTEAIGGNEAAKVLGQTLADALKLPPGSYVLVKARLPRRTFRNKGDTLNFHIDPRLPDDFMARAERHTWPGNVRELRNAVERAVLLPNHPTGGLEAPPKKEGTFGDVDIDIPFKTAKQQLVDEFDRRYLQALLEAHDNNISAAARAAGIERMSIYKMIRRLGLEEEGTKKRAPTGEDDSDESSGHDL